MPMVAASNLPAPLTNGELIQTALLDDVPSSDELAQWLLDKGLDTTDWGKENTKDVSKFWKEIKLNEAGLEVWRTVDGTLQPVRTVHVLRAKVTSPDRYQRGIFLFNTWQQYGDGRTRTRNGLLSEKLTTAEMPLEENLHEVCRRAVTEEEMQRVVESTMKIGPGRPAPKYDPSYKCPLEVVAEHFVDHIIELEPSKSYPGLLTMYHLYTVDIVCTGLPLTDLNTLEFADADKDGNRPLKYIHAWVWLEWPQIQRYLFEGSVLKETKGKGSFGDADALTTWLSQFDLHMDTWGKGTLKSVDSLRRVSLDATRTASLSSLPPYLVLSEILSCMDLPELPSWAVSSKSFYEAAAQQAMKALIDDAMHFPVPTRHGNHVSPVRASRNPIISNPYQ